MGYQAGEGTVGNGREALKKSGTIWEAARSTPAALTSENGPKMAQVVYPPLKILSIALLQTPGDRTAPARLRWFLSGGIVAKINQPKSVGHPFSIVEVKKSDRCATTGGNAFDKTTVEAKMAIPSLLAWMKEEDDFL